MMLKVNVEVYVPVLVLPGTFTHHPSGLVPAVDVALAPKSTDPTPVPASAEYSVTGVGVITAVVTASG